jgi:6-phosphogluconolactonase
MQTGLVTDTDFQRREFADGGALASALAEWTAERLRAATEARGAALLVVSGGKSPARSFDALSKLELDWTRVAITLADERRVPDDSPRSNARLVRETLLRNHAAVASFSPLADARLPEEQELVAASARVANLPLPADVVVLGMGEDGHTASWFPHAEGLEVAMDAGARQLVAPIRAAAAGEPRLTLTGRVILRAEAIALLIEGEAKLRTLEAALEPGPEEDMPIRAVLRRAADRLTVFSASRA